MSSKLKDRFELITCEIRKDPQDKKKPVHEMSQFLKDSIRGN